MFLKVGVGEMWGGGGGAWWVVLAHGLIVLDHPPTSLTYLPADRSAYRTNPQGRGPGAVVKAACLESQRSRLQTPLWPSSFKEKNVSPGLTRKYSILWGAYVAKR